MTWTAIIIMAVGTYALKASGLFAGARDVPPRIAVLLALLPASLLAALAAVQTFQTPGGLAIDARLLGVAGAGVALMWRAPFVVVVAVAMVVAAAARALAA